MKSKCDTSYVYMKIRSDILLHGPMCSVSIPASSKSLDSALTPVIAIKSVRK